jgi:hypothetical protein
MSKKVRSGGLRWYLILFVFAFSISEEAQDSCIPFKFVQLVWFLMTLFEKSDWISLLPPEYQLHHGLDEVQGYW